MTTLDDRVSRLEGINEEIRNRLDDMTGNMNSRFNSIENRLNAQLAISFVTLIAVIGALVVQHH